MKKLTSIIACLALSAITLSACSNGIKPLNNDYKRNTDIGVTYNYTDGTEQPPSIYNTYASYATDLELKIFRNYVKQNKADKSFVISPVNTVLQIGLLANGGADRTGYELTNMLGTDMNLSNINICSSYFKSRLQAVSQAQSGKTDSLSGKQTDTVEEYVKLENNLIFNDTVDVKSSFLQSATDFYLSDVFRMPFEEENSLSDVNSLFTDFTSEKPFSTFNNKHNLITASASSMSDKWLISYNKDKISKGVFNGKSGSRDCVYLESTENVLKTDNAKAVLKYTKSNPLKVMFIMPNEGISLDEYISDFTNLEYSNLLESFNVTKRETVRFPEFTINSTGKAESMKSILENCGLKTAFTEDSSFSGLSHSDDVFINDIYEINPNFALTAEGITTEKSTMSVANQTASADEKVFELNRSFLFVVLDNESNIPVYIGAVV